MKYNYYNKNKTGEFNTNKLCTEEETFYCMI